MRREGAQAGRWRGIGGEKVQIKEVSYRRIFNLGNYESAQVEMKATVSEGEDPKKVIDQLAAETKAWRKSKEAPSAA